ncbi:polyunsaturated fatty acid 5-lipoxygenase-like [Puntigrus tetrazona]|uniref:polyunsaturated fatty acid 5-lipoxygenase-like n=1 Tax=Puntigrus tetrazona TaxID=1606681 RepID=UPI001C89A5D5|nr:polyunsaturated fatty acid 5-lipoxygenase-like [Puntigrus tetrazona]
MWIYKVTVYSMRQIMAKATNSIYLTLMDSEQKSSGKVLVNPSFFSSFATELTLEIHVEKELTDSVQVKLEKKSHYFNYSWFCKHISVRSPFGESLEFPFYSWLEDKKEVTIQKGTARLPQDDTNIKERQEELKHRREVFRWKEQNQAFPKCIDDTEGGLPKDVQFDGQKGFDFQKNFLEASLELGLDKIEGLVESWKDITDFEKIFEHYNIKNTPLENVIQDWTKDYMFGYQFLNGCNPVMIKKCTDLPEKFPVTHEMVKGSLKGRQLHEELRKGNIYIVDYEILKDVPAASQRYLAAPICLLYKNEVDQMLPIAIQLSQTSGEMSPIFLPSDSKYDWMLAKMFVKSSDFIVHQLVTHLLKTHLVSEVFEIAMYRQLSAVHPVYKLLMPHVRFTIAINAEARKHLISEDGVFSKISSINADGMEKLVQNAMEALSFKSLNIHEDIKARGMEDTPNYYYRDDGLKIWEAIHHFVSAVVKIYYDSDEAVREDVEIQRFVKDVSCFGMNNSHKFPESLESREELIEYLTVVIFTASAQHAAVNFGQFDWYGWIPNSPSTMRRPPPQRKGEVDMKRILETLPDRDCSSLVLGTVWALTRMEKNELFLGMYPDTFFTEQPVKKAIKTFRKSLSELTETIKNRNEKLTLDYSYLSPDRVPNSVAI